MDRPARVGANGAEPEARLRPRGAARERRLFALAAALAAFSVALGARAQDAGEPPPDSRAEDAGEPPPAPRAEDAGEPPPAPRPSFWVDFEAGRVELDPDLEKLELSRDVSIRVDRYQLTSQRLTLTRTPSGIVVAGDGRVAFCRCPGPPVTLGFRRAIVAPPTDLYLEHPTVRAWGVPVLWLPLLWLRAPDRVGLLPPTVAWRGEDGLVAGAGVHLPLGGQRGPTLESLELFASGYFQGGVDLEARVTTPRTTTRARWDHLSQSALTLDARGSAVGPGAAGAAWRLDALRGERGRRSTVELEPAARRYDRGLASVGASADGFVGGLALEAYAVRGGAFDELGAVGPSAVLGFGSALGAGSSVDAGLALGTLRSSDERADTTLLQHVDVGGDHAVGPLLASATLGDRLLLQSSSEAGQSAVVAGGRLAVSLPLARRFGAARDEVVHRVEPFLGLSARAGARRARDSAPSGLYDDAGEARGLADAGIRTALGSYGRRSALSFTLRGGAVGAPEDPEALVASDLSADSDLGQARLEAAVKPSDREALYYSARSRLGPLDGLHVASHVEGRLARDPWEARMLLSEDWAAPSIGWLTSRGASAGGELAVPWTRELATAVYAEADLDRERLLALGGAVGYRHGCGCLASRAWVGRRVGRDGVDAMLTLDLMP